MLPVVSGVLHILLEEDDSLEGGRGGLGSVGWKVVGLITQQLPWYPEQQTETLFAITASV